MQQEVELVPDLAPEELDALSLPGRGVFRALAKLRELRAELAQVLDEPFAFLPGLRVLLGTAGIGKAQLLDLFVELGKGELPRRKIGGELVLLLRELGRALLLGLERGFLLAHELLVSRRFLLEPGDRATAAQGEEGAGKKACAQRTPPRRGIPNPVHAASDALALCGQGAGVGLRLGEESLQAGDLRVKGSRRSRSLLGTELLRGSQLLPGGCHLLLGRLHFAVERRALLRQLSAQLAQLRKSPEDPSPGQRQRIEFLRRQIRDQLDLLLH